MGRGRNSQRRGCSRDGQELVDEEKRFIWKTAARRQGNSNAFGPGVETNWSEGFRVGEFSEP